MPKFIDLQGRRFGRLIVLYRDMTGHSNDRHTYWVCRCDCGKFKTVRSDDLRSGLVVSCGCYHAEVSSKSCLNRGMAFAGVIRPMDAILDYGSKKRCMKIIGTTTTL